MEASPDFYGCAETFRVASIAWAPLLSGQAREPNQPQPTWTRKSNVVGKLFAMHSSFSDALVMLQQYFGDFCHNCLIYLVYFRGSRMWAPFRIWQGRKGTNKYPKVKIWKKYWDGTPTIQRIKRRKNNIERIAVDYVTDYSKNSKRSYTSKNLIWPIRSAIAYALKALFIRDIIID